MNEPAHEPSIQPDSGSSTTTTADDELLAALADDFAARLRRGEHPQVEEYVDKHPALSERIRKFLYTVQMIEQTRSFDVARASEGPGTIIGRYKLLERIGEGGFGVVYMAEQQHPVRRKVALKVIKPGIDTRQVIARFEAERQALALMDHPNIAKVLDAGATDSGRPYFVMELVKGVPITQYCDVKHLTSSQRLELFVDRLPGRPARPSKGDHPPRHQADERAYCRVRRAGGRRKSSTSAWPRRSAQQLTEKTLFTEFGQLVGTLEYMSPEQAKLNQLDIDTRSDIYSLGVLLYELLTGTTPLDRKRLKDTSLLRTAADCSGAGCRRRLSNRLNTTAELPAIAANRGLEPSQADEARARRAGLDRNEGAGEGPQPPLRNGQRIRRRRRAVFEGRTGGGVSAVGLVSLPQVRPSAASGAVDRGGDCLGGHADGGVAVRRLIWRANQNLHQALDRERDTLERERRNSYSQRIALANREWSANNLSRDGRTARRVPRGPARLGMALSQAAAVQLDLPASPRQPGPQCGVQPRRPVRCHGHPGRRSATLADERRPGMPEVAGSSKKCPQRRV